MEFTGILVSKSAPFMISTRSGCLGNCISFVLVDEEKEESREFYVFQSEGAYRVLRAFMVLLHADEGDKLRIQYYWDDKNYFELVDVILGVGPRANEAENCSRMRILDWPE